MTTTTPVREVTQPRSRNHVGLAILALATGGFAIGTTEFVTMGLLPQIANGVHVTVPQGGHLISAYALGVVVGVPLLAFFAARLPRKGLLMVLMAVYAAGNLASAAVASDGMLTLARFLTGIPHGVYFGVASLVAASLVEPARRGRAVASVMLGLTIANVAGVPAATWLGQQLGWRSAYVVVAGIALLTATLVGVFVPRSDPDPNACGRRELAALKVPQVWLTLLIGAIGFGGMFSMYSYIAKTVTNVTGLHESAVPIFLLAFGLGGTAGTWLAGRLTDWSVMRSLMIGSVGMGVALAVFTQTSRWAVPGWLTVFAISALGSVLVIGLQMRLMSVAGDAETLGAASNHASLNIANALGAWLGGLVIAAGYGYTSASWVGAALSFGGLLVLGVSAELQRRTTARVGYAERLQSSRSSS